MEIKGFILSILEARGGTSARTGNSWKVQSFVLETVEQYPKHLCFEVSGEDKLRQMDIKQGEEMTVSFDVDAHEYQGRWFNQIRAWKVEKTGRVINVQNGQAQTSNPPTSNLSPQISQGGQQVNFSGNNDNPPF